MKNGSVWTQFWSSCDQNGKKYYQGEFGGYFTVSLRASGWNMQELLSLHLFPSWSQFTLFPSNSAPPPSVCCQQVWGIGEGLQLEQRAVRWGSGCGLGGDPWWVWMPSDCVHGGIVLCLPRLILPGCSKNVTPAKAQVHRALTHPLTSLFFLAVHSASKLKWPAKLKRKWISKNQKSAKGVPLHHNHTQLWELRLDSLRFSALVGLAIPGEPQTGEFEDGKPWADLKVFWWWWKKSLNVGLWCWWRSSKASWPCPSRRLALSAASAPCPPSPILSSSTELEGLHVFHCKEVGRLWLVPFTWGCPPERSFQMNRLCRFWVQFTEEFLISVLLCTHLHNIFWFSEFQSY